jgi:hypothetical protein
MFRPNLNFAAEGGQIGVHCLIRMRALTNAHQQGARDHSVWGQEYASIWESGETVPCLSALTRFQPVLDGRRDRDNLLGFPPHDEPLQVCVGGAIPGGDVVIRLEDDASDEDAHRQTALEKGTG